MRTKLFLVLSIFTLQMNAQCWDKISSGAYHTIAIAHDGTLWAWGYNANGQVGNNTNLNQVNPVQISTDTDWVFVGAGYYHSFAIKANGTLWGWGYNAFGQLGNSQTSDRITPTQIGTASDWQSISGGENFSVAIKTNSTIWTVGSNSSGQLGTGNNFDRSSFGQLGTLSDWSQAAAGRFHVIALKTDGKLYAWGNNLNGQLSNGGFGATLDIPTLVTTTGTANFIKVTASPNASLALRQDNSLWIAGLIASTNTTFFQQFAFPTTWSNVSAGANHIIGAKSDGTLWAYGNNSLGQISQPGFSGVNSPYQVTGTNFSTELGTNFYSSLVLKNDGGLYSFGQNHVGQLADNTIVDKNSITAIYCPAVLSSDPFEIQNSISLYPNPVLNQLNISNTSEIESLTIYDIAGKQIKYQDGNTSSITVEDLKSGFYLLEISIEGKKEIKKFVKQ